MRIINKTDSYLEVECCKEKYDLIYFYKSFSITLTGFIILGIINLLGATIIIKYKLLGITKFASPEVYYHLSFVVILLCFFVIIIHSFVDFDYWNRFIINKEKNEFQAFGARFIKPYHIFEVIRHKGFFIQSKEILCISQIKDIKFVGLVDTVGSSTFTEFGLAFKLMNNSIINFEIARDDDLLLNKTARKDLLECIYNYTDLPFDQGYELMDKYSYYGKPLIDIVKERGWFALKLIGLLLILMMIMLPLILASLTK